MIKKLLLFGLLLSLFLLVGCYFEDDGSEVSLIDGFENLSVNGSVVAGVFVGNGSGLFGLNVSCNCSVNGSGNIFDQSLNTSDSVEFVNVTSTGYFIGDGSLLTGIGGGSGTLTGSGTAWYIPMWNGTTSLNNSVIYQSGNNVGIGTTSPGYKFVVNGTPAGNGDLIELYGTATHGAMTRYNRGGAYTWSTGIGGSSATTGLPFSYYGIVENGATPRLVIAHTTGNVGIGTTSPTSKLYVLGNAFYGQYTNSVGRMEFGYSGDNSQFLMRNSAGVATNLFGTYGVSYFNGGNVGIGTTSPTEILHINSSGHVYPLIETTMTNGNAGLTFDNDANRWTIGIAGDNGDRFTIALDDDFHTNRYFVIDDASGNVGIGTTSPEQKLHVYNGHIKLSNNYGLIGTGYSNGIVPDSITYGHAQTFTGYNGQYFFGWNGSSYVPTVRITAGGNVGIGTTSPSYPLEVNGSVSGISIYALNNISAEDYLYHSPFPKESYTGKQALSDLMNVHGENGKIVHESAPANAVSTLKKQVPLMVEKVVYEEECSYKLTFNNQYKKVCVEKPVFKMVEEQICHNITKEFYELDSVTGNYDKIINTDEVCEVVYSEEVVEEPQVSVGMLLGDVILSIQELQKQNKDLRSELCKKDNSYKFC